MSSTTVLHTIDKRNELNNRTNERTNQKTGAIVQCNIGAGSFTAEKGKRKKKQLASNEDCEIVAEIELNSIETETNKKPRKSKQSKTKEQREIC